MNQPPLAPLYDGFWVNEARQLETDISVIIKRIKNCYTKEELFSTIDDIYRITQKVKKEIDERDNTCH